MAEVYARRWDIEMALALVKQHLKLRLLWSAEGGDSATDMATLIISQVLQSMRLEIAHKAGVTRSRCPLVCWCSTRPSMPMRAGTLWKSSWSEGVNWVHPTLSQNAHPRPRHTRRGDPAGATRTGANSHTAIRQSQMFQTYRQLTKSELVGTDGVWNPPLQGVCRRLRPGGVGCVRGTGGYRARETLCRPGR